MSAAAIAAALPRQRQAALPWRLLWLPVCASTETELARRLAAGLSTPLAVIARHQTRGHGQQGRQWLSPPGGVWLSAALPSFASASPSLAVSLGLCLQLESLGLQPRIKWPNDLMLENRKLAGVLPRMRWRGSRLMGFSVGVGLNGFNRVPAGAINLAEGLRLARPRLLVHPQCHPDRLAALVLRALEWAVSASDNAELVRRQAEQRLWRSGPHWHEGQSWQVVGLSIDGGLRLRDGQRLVELRRHF